MDFAPLAFSSAPDCDNGKYDSRIGPDGKRIAHTDKNRAASANTRRAQGLARFQHHRVGFSHPETSASCTRVISQR